MAVEPLLETMLAHLRAEAKRLGSELIEEGLNMVEARLRGEATERELWEWLRKAQTPATGEEEAS